MKGSSTRFVRILDLEKTFWNGDIRTKAKAAPTHAHNLRGRIIIVCDT